MATSTKFRAARKRARPFAIACDYPDQQGSMQPTTKLATSEKFRVARKRARPSAIARDHPTQQGSAYPTIPVPDRAALACSLSSSKETRP
ncbi:hypothetical protein EDB86DRAFT_3084561 [Lactarius hatsudake]|nr:hypothetical protein EDB86DRAFT_3084561 [Lactarius hatsudake]